MEWIGSRLRPETEEEAELLKTIGSVGLHSRPVIKIEQCGEEYLPLGDHETRLVGRGIVNLVEDGQSYHGITPEQALKLKHEMYGEPEDYFPKEWCEAA